MPPKRRCTQTFTRTVKAKTIPPPTIPVKGNNHKGSTIRLPLLTEKKQQKQQKLQVNVEPWYMKGEKRSTLYSGERTYAEMIFGNHCRAGCAKRHFDGDQEKMEKEYAEHYGMEKLLDSFLNDDEEMSKSQNDSNEAIQWKVSNSDFVDNLSQLMCWQCKTNAILHSINK